MTLELDLFSGRPNPSVELGAEEVGELLRRLDSLPRSPLRELPEPPALGYRGVQVRADSNAPILIYRGVVRQGGEGPLVDPGRSLERWLLQTLAERLEPGLRPTLQEILREL